MEAAGVPLPWRQLHLSLYIFIAMAEYGLMRFTPSQLGRFVGVLFRFHIIHASTMGKASHCCPFGYGEAMHG
ncbi:hypothetical protein SLEP1_g58103 [Rubroshorea leprosula]|uniref:Uncharacterized protein n=1 Tax=Rubroshorea leprosula TaxID=152421 RepID=A0AAV5MRU0_9ROSI|nr:hypothetical protein SLEP1_g58103 [Rubroshorea leprosula]